MAAVLACGPGAVLSHTSAARFWRIFRRPSREAADDGRPSIHVTVPSRGGRRRRNGLIVHRSETLGPDQITRRDGIPVTTPSRTLIDLRRILPQPQFASALREAQFLRLPIDARLEPDRTRSDLEAKFLRLCRRHRLTKPEVNVRVDPYLVDFLWRERDIQLKVMGYHVVRLTWRQLSSEPAETAARLRTLLGLAPTA
jgi:hypothetical protein